MMVSEKTKNLSFNHWTISAMSVFFQNLFLMIFNTLTSFLAHYPPEVVREKGPDCFVRDFKHPEMLIYI